MEIRLSAYNLFPGTSKYRIAIFDHLFYIIICIFARKDKCQYIIEVELKKFDKSCRVDINQGFKNYCSLYLNEN